MKRRCMLGCVNVFEKTRQPDIVSHRPGYQTSVAHQSQPPVEAGVLRLRWCGGLWLQCMQIIVGLLRVAGGG